MLISAGYKYFVRTIFIGFWLICLLFFLFLPHVTSWWVDEKVLNILIWTGNINKSLLKDFEQETGIKINIMYFDNNEELFVKLYAIGGRGYDLIMPSDYAVAKLIQYELIQPIEKNEFSFFDHLDPRLVNRYFDPDNKYTLPYYWGIIGIGINKDFFKDMPPQSWDLLFELPYMKYGVGMVNVAHEALLMASLHLFNTIDIKSDEELKKIETLLIKQKKYVQAYIDADVRSNYMLLSQAAGIVIASTPYIQKIMQENDNIEFIIPKKGGFIIIDNLAIPKACRKKKNVYTLIEYLYKPEILKKLVMEQPFFPATKDLDNFMKEAKIPISIQQVHMQQSVPLYFLKKILPDEVIDKIWLKVKTA